MFAVIPAAVGHKIVDRGDPAALDFTLTQLTVRDTWTDLDLSSIIPKTAKGVLIHIEVNATAANKNLWLRKKGNSNEINIVTLNTQSGNISIFCNKEVFCDNNGVIQYKIETGTWNAINLAIARWFV